MFEVLNCDRLRVECLEPGAYGVAVIPIAEAVAGGTEVLIVAVVTAGWSVDVKGLFEGRN